MAFRICMWSEEVADHIAQHGVSMDDFEDVLADPEEELVSESSGLPAVTGYTGDGRRLFCVFREIDEVYVQPVTAYEIEG